MTDIIKELIQVVKNYCNENGINCRVNKSQFEMADIGTRNGCLTAIVYYTNKSAGLKLYIDYDVTRGVDNEVLAF